MNERDTQIFNDAVNLAYAGKKKEAYSLLKKLHGTYYDYTNLLLWLAFCAPDLETAERWIERAAALADNSPSVIQAQEWLAHQKADNPQANVVYYN